MSSWDITIFPFNGVSDIVIGGDYRAGVVSDVAGDLSAATPVSFSSPLTLLLGQQVVVTATVVNDALTNPQQFVVDVYAVSDAGFYVTVSGGAPGSTVSISYLAVVSN